jgi:hypothetical protein
MMELLSSAVDSPAKIGLVLIAVAVSAWVVQTFVEYRRLQHFDGPFLASISRLWIIRAATSGHQHAIFADVCQKYGTWEGCGSFDGAKSLQVLSFESDRRI